MAKRRAEIWCHGAAEAQGPGTARLIFGTGGYAAGKIREQYACTSNNIQVFPGRGACAALFGPFGVLQASGQTLSGGWFAGVGFEHDLPLKGTLKTMC
jgi:hypothetical protein